MELILVVGVTMIMALISLISMLSQKNLFANNQIKWQWHEQTKSIDD